MANLKLKIKKVLFKRKMEGVTVPGYIGRCITNGTATFEEILKISCKGSTLDFREAELAAKMLIDGITENLKNGKIVDLGPVGKLYPAVNGKWVTDPDELSLSDMKPKVNYSPGDDIAAAIRGAQLSWTTEAENEENTVNDPDNQGGTQQGGDTGDNGGGNNGGGDDNGGGDYGLNEG